MTSFEMHSTRDLIIYESKYQKIGIVGVSISLTKYLAEASLTHRIFNFLDSIGVSYVITLKSNSVRVLFLIDGRSLGEITSKAALVVDKIDKIKTIDNSIILFKVDHVEISQTWENFHNTKVKRTKNQRILTVGDSFLVAFSLKIKKTETEYFTRYIKEILKESRAKLNLSVRINGSKGEKRRTQGMIITANFMSLNKAEQFIAHTETIARNYINKFSCTIRFHTSKEIKNNKTTFMFGISPLTYSVNDESDIIHLNSFLHQPNKQNLTIMENEEEKISQQENRILNSDDKQEIRNKGREKRMVDDNLNNNYKLGTQSEHKGEFVSALDYVLSRKQEIKKGKKEKLLFEYGKAVSDEEKEELIEKIPPPPA